MHPGRALGVNKNTFLPRKQHLFGCHRPRVDDRAVLSAILFVLRFGAQWNALNITGICLSSSAHWGFQEWFAAGVFEAFWRHGLLAIGMLQGIDWTWLSIDGAMAKVPLCGEKPDPILRIAGKAESNVACLLMPRECLSC